MPSGPTDSSADIAYLRQAIAVAQRAREKGNHPFGAILVDASGAVIAEAENTFLVDGGPGHAEANLARYAARSFSPDELRRSVLYTTVEPCCMCAGAIYWSNIGGVVYGMSERQLLELTQEHAENPTLDLPCRTVFNAGRRQLAVRGPIAGLAEEIAMTHRGFWDNRDSAIRPG